MVRLIEAGGADPSIDDDDAIVVERLSTAAETAAETARDAAARQRLTRSAYRNAAVLLPSRNSRMGWRARSGVPRRWRHR